MRNLAHTYLNLNHVCWQGGIREAISQVSADQRLQGTHGGKAGSARQRNLTQSTYICIICGPA